MVDWLQARNESLTGTMSFSWPCSPAHIGLSAPAGLPNVDLSAPTFAISVPEKLRGLRQERLSTLRPFGEFFDHQRILAPQRHQRSLPTRHLQHAPLLGQLRRHRPPPHRLRMINDTLLLVALVFLVGGFWAINRFAPEPMQVGEHMITQKSLYTGCCDRHSTAVVCEPVRVHVLVGGQFGVFDSGPCGVCRAARVERVYWRRDRLGAIPLRLYEVR